MKTMQICPKCGKQITFRQVYPLFSRGHIRCCPYCKTPLQIKAAEKIMILLSSGVMIGILILIEYLAVKYSLPVGKASVWDDILYFSAFFIILLLYFLIYGICHFIISVLMKRQSFVLEEREKPLYRADYELFSSGFEKEITDNNILELKIGTQNFYILLRNVTESDFQFHFVPYQNGITLPEEAELSNGKEIITILKHIREIK